MAGRVFLKWRVADLLVGFPDIEFGFVMRVRSLPGALRLATPKTRLPGAGGGFLTSSHKNPLQRKNWTHGSISGTIIQPPRTNFTPLWEHG